MMLKKSIKKVLMMGTIFVATVMGSVSASNYLNTTSISSQHTNCDGGIFPVVYYAGTDNLWAKDVYNNTDSKFLWWMLPSKVMIYNPYSLLKLPTGMDTLFAYKSQVKPHNVNSVVVTQVTKPLSIASVVPNNYTSRILASQLVYNINRKYYKYTSPSGNNSYTKKYLLPGGTNTLSYTFGVAAPSGTKSDYECRNIYVGFCGDGVLDNGNKNAYNFGKYTSKNPFDVAKVGTIKLKGGEECDPALASSIPAGAKCTATCKLKYAEKPSCNSTYNGKSHYGKNWLNASTNGLCSKGTMENFSGPNGNGNYSWDCKNSANEKVSCKADENWCGDKVKQSNEKCDPKDPNKEGWGNGGCSATCSPINKNTYDLALRKTVVSKGPFKPGDKVEFSIVVYNQGDVETDVIKVVDHIPEGLEVIDKSRYDTSKKVIWKKIGKIKPGNTATFPLETRIKTDFTGTIIKNIAEISEDDGDDCDSTPDEDPNNDKVIDDYIGTSCNNNDGDEDDHDIAIISVEKSKAYDLALRKTVVSTGSFKPGDEVKFNIEIYNQGNIDADIIEVVDYIPTGMELTDKSWTVDGNMAKKVVKNIKAAKKKTVSITMKIKDDFTGTSIKNIAEISEDDGDDVDSTPDNNPDNDCEMIDDEIGKTCPVDEDDHDIAIINVRKTKLTITKKLISNEKGGSYNVGEVVKFRIDVKNEGTLTVNDIVVKDVMPSSLDYVSSKNVSAHTGTLNTTTGTIDEFNYSDIVLKAGETFSFEVIGKVKENPDQNQTTNCATIISPKGATACDKFGLRPEPELDKKQRVNNRGSFTGDILDVKKSDTVNYRISFKNIGSATAHNVVLVDDLPKCLSYVDGTATINLANNDYVFKHTYTNGHDKLTYSRFSMKPGQGLTVTLDATVKNTEACKAEDYKNTAALTFGDQILTDSVIVNIKKEKLTCSISLNTSNALTITEDDATATTTVKCSTTQGETAKKIIIKCGDGTTPYTVANTNNATFYCNYTTEGTFKPSCEIFGDELDSICNAVVTVKKEIEYYGECGNGERDPGEDCDWEGDEKKLKSKNSKLFKYGSNRDLEWFLDREDKDYNDYKSFRCTDGCRIKGKKKKKDEDEDDREDFIATIPRCLSTDVPISVQEGELMPFWWRLEKSGIDIIDEKKCSKRSQENAQDDDKTLISQNHLVCHFIILDAKGDEVDGFDIEGDKCWKRAANEKNEKEPIYEFFFDTKYDAEGFSTYNNQGYDWGIAEANGKSTLDISDYISKKGGKKMYGEYKLVLEKVESKFCTPKGKWKDAQIYNRVCTVNYTVTKPYLIQKGLFGLFPVGANKGREFFSNFYEMHEGESLFNGKNFRKYLGDATITNDSDYTITSDLKTKIDAFKKKYKALAVKVGTTKISKVPGKNIYFVEGNLELTNTKNYVKDKYTIISNGTVTIKGSVKTNGMIIANKIKFIENKEANEKKGFRCEKGGQTVQGIFIAEGSDGFEGDDDSNLNNLDKNKDTKERCNYGNLKVEGVLIGNGIDTLVSQKRSHLNGWFWVESHKKSDVETERRREIFDGAAVQVEYNPYLWSDLPPGANDFIKALEIYKN